jgi:hypothetical protein
VALGEGRQIDRAALVDALADLPFAVMRLNGEQHAAAFDRDNVRRCHDGAADRRRGEVTDIGLGYDVH